MSRGIKVAISERLLGECIQKNNELQQEIKSCRKLYEDAKRENEKLKEALRKCVPLETYWDDSDLEGGYVDRCIFCDVYEKTGYHSPDCEYINLCK